MPTMSTPCHIWTGGKNKKGYGVINLGARGEGTALTSRVAFFLEHGRWPEPCALHRCDNPPCVRGDHLFEGTRADNVADALRKGRHVAPVVGHGENNPHSKLTAGLAEYVRASLARGVPQTLLAEELGVHKTTIGSIARGKTWKAHPSLSLCR
jgi:hypothetical protein